MKQEPNNKNERCKLCGEPMPDGEDMFMYHGHSGPCPKPPAPPDAPENKAEVPDDDCSLTHDCEEAH